MTTTATPIRDGYDEVAEVTTPGMVLSEIVDVHRSSADEILRVTALGKRRGGGRDTEGGLPQQSAQAKAWQQLGGAGLVISPPYEPTQLIGLVHLSSILPQCIRALAQGVHGHGRGFDPLFDGDEADEAFLEAAEAERERADLFFRDCSLDYSFAELVVRTRIDIAAVGWSGWELIRDVETGALVGLEHVSATTLRLGVPDTTPTLINRWVIAPDGSGWRRVSAWKYLRRFVQVTSGRLVFFKEIGDPRAINRHTGAVMRTLENSDDLRNPNVARELLWFANYDPGNPDGYGVPDWIGTMVDVGSERAAAEKNWDYLQNGAIPALAVLMSGGTISPEKLKNLEERFDEVRGPTSGRRMLFIEAKDSGATWDARDLAAGAAQAPSLKIERLTDAQQNDGTHQELSRNSRNKTRSSIGVPPILVGESNDYTRATAEVSMQVAEAFTFAPQRERFDDRVNRFIMSELRVKWWRFRSGAPNLASVDEIAAAIDAGTKAGVGSPNIYAQVLERVLGVEIPQSEMPWASFPFDLTKIALQAGLVSIDFAETGEMSLDVHEQNRERFKALVEEMIESVLERAIIRARYEATGEGDRWASQ